MLFTSLKMQLNHARRSIVALAPCSSFAIRSQSITCDKPPSKRFQRLHKDIRSLKISAQAAAPPAAAGTNIAATPKRLAIFVSGGGSNFKAIHAAILNGTINATVAAVVTNSSTCGGANYAREHGIPVIIYPAPKADPSAGVSPQELVTALTNELSVDFVILAGYLKLIPSELVRAYRRSILNIHPGLLPSFGGKGFYGSRVHQAVIASGARFSGPTIHFIDEEYDTGPILAQAVVPVYPTDSPEKLAARVLKEVRTWCCHVCIVCSLVYNNKHIHILWKKYCDSDASCFLKYIQEHKLYPVCVAALCDGRITWREDGIPVLWHCN